MVRTVIMCDGCERIGAVRHNFESAILARKELWDNGWKMGGLPGGGGDLCPDCQAEGRGIGHIEVKCDQADKTCPRCLHSHWHIKECICQHLGCTKKNGVRVAARCVTRKQKKDTKGYRANKSEMR